MQVDQNVDEGWPLLLVDLKGEKKEVLLQPGQMLLYESAKVPHGRQRPLNGTFYDNVFVHFRPSKAWYETEEEPKVLLTKEDLI